MEVNGEIVGVCIQTEHVPGIVIVKNDHLYCSTCKKTVCVHKKCGDQLKISSDGFRGVVEQLYGSDRSFSNNNNKTIHTYSCKKIPFEANSEISQALKRLSEMDRTTSLSPIVGVVCHCGSTTFEELVDYEERNVITMTRP